MNDDLSDIRGRQDRLEGRMTQLEAKVELEAGLRAAMDRELGTISAKLNAHQQSLNALQAVQGDHTRRLTRIEDRLTGVEGRLTGVEGRLENVETDLVIVKSDLVTVKTGVHAILDLLDTNLAKKSLADRLADRLLRRRDDGTG
jgi:chromosome segregation ATPase